MQSQFQVRKEVRSGKEVIVEVTDTVMHPPRKYSLGNIVQATGRVFFPQGQLGEIVELREPLMDCSYDFIGVRFFGDPREATWWMKPGKDLKA